jgi:DNA-binding PadR family transcriptional regulator
MDAHGNVGDFLPVSPADLQLLLILLTEDLHAYGIARAAEEQERWSVPLELGSLYRMLDRLQRSGLVAADPQPRPSPSGPRRKLYRITDLGRHVVAAEIARMRDVVEVGEERLRPRRA